MKLEKINKYDPFSDENEYKFYTSLITLSEDDLNFYSQNRNFNKGTGKSSEYAKKIDFLLDNKIMKSETKESIDEIALEIIKSNYSYLNQEKGREYLITSLFQYEQSLSLIPQSTVFTRLKMNARLIADLSLIYKEMSTEVTDILKEDFYYYVSEKNKNSLFEDKVFNARAICELVKFGIM